MFACRPALLGYRERNHTARHFSGGHDGMRKPFGTRVSGGVIHHGRHSGRIGPHVFPRHRRKQISHENGRGNEKATDMILEAGLSLLRQHWDEQHPVRLVGISVSGLGEEEGQISILDVPLDDDSSVQGIGPDEKKTDMHAAASLETDAGVVRQRRNQVLDTVVDALRNRFGVLSVQRAALVGRERPKRHVGKDSGVSGQD